jgi:Uma2 family endonuclease
LRQIALAVEVSESSYKTDRHIKWRKYAASGIPVYWIVSLDTRSVEIFTRPAGRGKAAGYTESQAYNSDARVPVALGGREIGNLKVSEFLP